MSARMIALVAGAALATVACGRGELPTNQSSSSPSQAGSSPSAGSSTPGSSAALAAATPPAVPATPLLVYRTPQGALAVVDAAGSSRWAVDPRTLVPAGASWSASVGGPHLLVNGGDAVVVVDRAGAVVGRGTYTGGEAPQTDHAVAPDPSGTRWTWSTTIARPTPPPGAPPSSWPPFRGAVWVAGVGERPHVIRTWSEPSQSTLQVFQWSDAGIVTAVVPELCAGVPQERSTALLDPATGVFTPLFGADRHLSDVHAGLEVGIRTGPTTASVLIAGRTTQTVTTTLAVPGEYLTGAWVSPGGSGVVAGLYAQGGCGGLPQGRTLVVDPVGGPVRVIPGEVALGWYDDAHTVMFVPGTQRIEVVDLSGRGAVVATGWYVGVLR